MKLYQAVQLGFFIYGWYKRASKDGNITQDEKQELAAMIIELVFEEDE